MALSLNTKESLISIFPSSLSTAMATFTGLSLPPKTLTHSSAPRPTLAAAAAAALAPPPVLRLGSGEPGLWGRRRELRTERRGGGRGSLVIAAAVDGEYSSRRSSSSEPRETIMLPGCDYNHWLIVMEFPKDPAPTREQMIDTYLNTLATVLGSMEEAKKNMYAFSTTTYTGFQCTVDEATSEKFKGLPGVLWVLPDSYIDVKNKDYGGDKYINGEIIPCQYPTYQPKPRNNSRYESRRYERKRDGPPRQRPRPKQEATSTESSST